MHVPPAVVAGVGPRRGCRYLLRWLRGHGDTYMRGASFSPGVVRLAATSADLTTRPWRVHPANPSPLPRPEHTLRGHRGCVNTVVFSPDLESQHRAAAQQCRGPHALCWVGCLLPRLGSGSDGVVRPDGQTLEHTLRQVSAHTKRARASGELCVFLPGRPFCSFRLTGLHDEALRSVRLLFVRAR